jgi:predicted transposase YbfD/YdcC
VLGELAEVPAVPAGLWACLRQVVDPRKYRGVRHPVTAIVAVAVAATLAGAQSFVATAEQVADASDADLAALCQHTGTVFGQMTVGAKTNDFPVLTKLLDTMDTTEAVITADALQCQHGTAQYIVSRGAHYVLTVKDNQRNLRKQLTALPWTQITVLSTDREHSHRRAASGERRRGR